MTNDIVLKGTVRNIQPSHVTNGVNYDKADIIVPRASGKEDIINLRFKHSELFVHEGDYVELMGNVRSFSRVVNNKSSVQIYVYTHFDSPETDIEGTNKFTVTGRVCKVDAPRVLSDGKMSVHFILANNIISADGTRKLNSYLPCVAWGYEAENLQDINVNDEITLTGELHSREYKKTVDGEIQIKVAHELAIQGFTAWKVNS